MRCLDAFVSRSILASSVIALAFASPGRAQFTWTNAAGGNWSVGANWGGTGPTAGGSATTTLTWGPSATYTSTDDFGAPTGFALNQMTFNHASGTVTIAASAGGTLDFSGTTPVLNVNGAGNAIINMPVNNLSAGATLVNLSVGLNVNSTGNLTVSGPLGGNLTNGSGGVGNGFYFGFAGGGSGTGTLTFNSPATSTTGYFHLSNANTVVTGGGVYNLAADANNTPQPSNTVEAPRSALMVGLTGGVTNSTFLLTGGTTINAADNVYFGAVTGNVTNAIIRGAGTVLNCGTTINGVPPNSGRFGPGNAGTGNVTIDQGAVVNCALLFNARLLGSSGDVIVDGAGSQLNAVTNAAITNSGQYSVGNQSTGTVTIRNGATSNGRNIIIANTGASGNTGAGNGILTITGTGSLLTAGGHPIIGGTTNDAGQIVVASGTAGSTGTTMGTLNVLAGGHVILNNDGAATPAGGNFFSANATNSVGVTNVAGAGSLLSIANQFSLDSAGGSATMNINSSGAVTVGGLSLLCQSTTAGTAALNLDTGGTFTGTGQFQTGPGATATVTSTVMVQGGGNATINNTAFFSVGTAATTTFSVTGASSIFQTTGTGQLQLGGAGVTAGGTVTTTVGSGGTIKTTSLLVLFGGAGTNVNTGGTLSAGAIADGVTGTSVGNITTQAGGSVLITGEVTQSYSGVISGGGSVTKSGAGQQTFSGTHTYTGGTQVNGGFLVITGTILGSAAAPVAVNNGGTLLGTSGVAGAGQISGNLNVNLGGTLTMGDGTATNPTGILTVTGPVAMVSGANFTLVMNGNTPGIGTASHDQLNLTGGGSIAIGNSTLNTALGYTPGGTDTITFITGGAVSGIFAGKPDNTSFFVGAFGGQNYAATIHYTATSVFLNTFTPVPEPLHILALGGLAAGGFGWWKRRKK